MNKIYLEFVKCIMKNMENFDLNKFAGICNKALPLFFGFFAVKFLIRLVSREISTALLIDPYLFSEEEKIKRDLSKLFYGSYFIYSDLKNVKA